MTEEELLMIAKTKGKRFNNLKLVHDNLDEKNRNAGRIITLVNSIEQTGFNSPNFKSPLEAFIEYRRFFGEGKSVEEYYSAISN